MNKEIYKNCKNSIKPAYDGLSWLFFFDRLL